jgi:hypothetical protein
VSCYYFLISYIIILSLTCIFVVFARINMAKKWCDAMESGSIRERQILTQWPCMLEEGERVIDGELMVPF